MKMKDFDICKNSKCNKIYKPINHNQKYCSRECQLFDAEENRKLRYYAEKEKIGQSSRNIRGVALAAKEAGMSYGMFVAKGGTAKGLPESKDKLCSAYDFKKPKRKYPQRSRESYESRRKKVLQIDANGNEIIYDSVTDAAKCLGIGKSAMSQRIRQRKTIEGFMWTYVEDKANEAT